MQPEPGRVNRLLATLLVDCPEPSLREPAQGLALARTYARKPLDLRLLGLAEFRNGNWQQAEVALSGHVERSTKPHIDRHGLAMANWKLGKKDKAFDWLLQGMSTPPTSDAVERYHHEAVNLIPAEEIIAECTRRLEDGELLPCYLARGEAHVRLKQTEAAVSDFVKAMELQRARGGEVGMIYRRLAAFPEVVEAVATLRPKDRTLWLEVARYHGLFWRWDQMAEAYRNYVELTPASGLNAGLLRDLALASLLAGDEDGYRRTCQRMAERWGETQSPGHLQVLASTCVANEQSPVADARVLQWAEKAVRGMPHSAEVHRTAGLGYYRLGQLHKAIACFEKANLLDGGPHSATAFCLALAHQRLGNPRESRRYYDFAVALHQSRRPDPPDVPSRARDLGYLLQCELLSRQARALLEGR
jgi:tetratricopeptide (TPR) repeat protein